MTETEAPYIAGCQRWKAKQRADLAEEVLHCLMTIWGGDNESDYNEVADRLDGIDEIVACKLAMIFRKAAMDKAG